MSRSRAGSLSVSDDGTPKRITTKDLENYYTNIKKNVIDFQFEFTVSIKKNQTLSHERQRQLLVNIKDLTVILFKLKKDKKKKIKKYNIVTFERIYKDKTENKLMVLSRKNGKKELYVMFANAERRELCYELMWMSRGGRVKIVPSKDERAPFDKLKLFITTWNVGDAMPAQDQLNGWIPNDGQYDIYAIGVQECEYQPKDKEKEKEKDKERDGNRDRSTSNSPSPVLHASNHQPSIIVNQNQTILNSSVSSNSSSNSTSVSLSTSPNTSLSPVIGNSPTATPSKQHMRKQSTSNNGGDCETHWYSMIGNHLGHNYYKLQSISMVKMRLVIFVKKEHYYKINFVEKDDEATGLGNVYGNKGGVCISFNFLETSFCFINSHFAAHQEKVETRNQNYRDIVKGLDHVGSRHTDIINQFHHVFWMGDFNYRIDMFREEALLAIRTKNINKLLVNDQLALQKVKEKVFLGFREPPITFMPTYKMERGVVGVFSEEKSRVPSWCDRILYKPLPYAPYCVCSKYGSVPTVTTSDHIPVYSIYDTYVQRPCLPIQRTQKNTVIELFDLGALQLDVDDQGNPPDPYLVFHPNSFVEESVATGHASKTRNPVWGDVPPIHPVIHKRSFLENQYLFITVFDDRGDGRKLGHCAIPLGLGYSKEPYSFQTRITKYGCSAGILYGKIIITGDDQLTDQSQIHPQLYQPQPQQLQQQQQPLSQQPNNQYYNTPIPLYPQTNVNQNHNNNNNSTINNNYINPDHSTNNTTTDMNNNNNLQTIGYSLDKIQYTNTSNGDITTPPPPPMTTQELKQLHRKSSSRRSI